MANALIHISCPYMHLDDDYTEITVIKDSHNVLMMDVHEAGCFELSEYVDEISKFKTGYYMVDYDYHEEVESWEMPNVKYPVIDEWDMERIWYGILISWYESIRLFITRSHKYGY